MIPPKDDILSVIEESLSGVCNGDIIVITAKIVAIDEGCCYDRVCTNKSELIEERVDIRIPRPYWNTPILVTNNTFLGSAGVDESNGGGYYISLPRDCMKSAKRLYKYILKRFDLFECGVVIVDSRSQPFRYGVTGVALGWWGFEPMQNHKDRSDLFGRNIRFEASNLVDGIASASVLVMGEVDEQTPMVIARNVPRVVYKDHADVSDLYTPYKDDMFRILYERWLK